MCYIKYLFFNKSVKIKNGEVIFFSINGAGKTEYTKEWIWIPEPHNIYKTELAGS
jgi:hypothetical protein